MTEDTITTEMTSTFVGQVYKIWSSECDKCYVGSTKQLLRQRFSTHKYDFRAWQKGKGCYVTSFEILAHDDAEIELIEEREFGDKQAMLECEKYWIQTLDTVNKFRPILTRDERRQDLIEWKYRSRDKKLAHQKKYNDEHKVQHTDYMKTYTSTCPHCALAMRKDNLKRHIGRKHAQE